MGTEMTRPAMSAQALEDAIRRRAAAQQEMQRRLDEWLKTLPKPMEKKQ